LITKKIDMVKPIVWRPEEVESIQSRYEKLLRGEGEKKFIFALFTGNPTEAAESWCTDCIVAHPIVNSVARAYEGPAVFYFIPVGTRDEFGDKNHPMKKHYPYLQAVPTMTLWNEFERWRVADKINADEIWYQIAKYKLR
jgi:thiol-disulfide isomerase/thioredoxin